MYSINIHNTQRVRVERRSHGGKDWVELMIENDDGRLTVVMFGEYEAIEQIAATLQHWREVAA